MLGRSGAGIAQHGALTLALVRALHEQQGFNVLAIDGPLWECAPELNPSPRTMRR